MTTEQPLSIGDLARAAGVTPRTIRHYEDVGLLPPVPRTTAGYRVYDGDAAARLYRIVALRALGLGVEDLRTVLDHPDETAALREAASRHLAHLDRQLVATQALRTTVARLAHDPTTTTALEATAMTLELDRITTGTGDDGTTGIGPVRVPKDDRRVEALGALDEVNARLGVLVSAGGLDPEAAALVGDVQQRLFDIGGDVVRCETGDRPRLGGAQVDALTAEIAARTERQAPLTSMVIPGGGPVAAALHTGRTAARTAERRLVALDEDALADATTYLNRLSDLLFVLARDAADDEQVWVPLAAPGAADDQPTG